MGVDITHIIENSFFDTSNREQNIAFLEQTRLKLSDFYFNKRAFNVRVEEFEDYPIEYYIDSNIRGMEIQLAKGFWNVQSFFRYYQLFSYSNPKNYWLRKQIFDLMRALDQKRVIHCDEYQSWNRNYGKEREFPNDFTLDEWLKLRKEKIPIFNADMTPSRVNWDNNFDYSDIYYDYFDDCFKELQEIRNLFPDYEINQINRIGDNFILGKKNNKLFLLDENTQEPLKDVEFDGVSLELNGTVFILQLEDKQSLFSNKGIQMTDFRAGEFDWKWNKGSNKLSRIIIDCATKIEYKID